MYQKRDKKIRKKSNKI